MKTIMFDVDGVLAGFLGGYARLWTTVHQRPFDYNSHTTWDDYWDKNVWGEIRRSSTFWLTLEGLVDVLVWSRIDTLIRHHNTYFVTNRVGPNPKQQTEQWLRRHVSSSPTVVVTGKKGEFARAVGADYAIDDKAGNAVFMQYHSPKTKSYLLDTPFNRFDHAVLGAKVVRVATVDTFLDQVEAA